MKFVLIFIIILLHYIYATFGEFSKNSNIKTIVEINSEDWNIKPNYLMNKQSNDETYMQNYQNINELSPVQDSRRNIHLFGSRLRAQYPIFFSVASDIKQGVSIPFNNKLGTSLNFVDVCLGKYYFAALTDNGDLYINGAITTNSEGSYLAKVNNLKLKISQISCGPTHILVLGEGKLLVAGLNEYSVIGIKEMYFSDTFIPLEQSRNFSSISTTNFMSIFLSGDRKELYSVGHGLHGNSIIFETKHSLFLVYKSNTTIIDIAIAHNTGFILDSNHCIYMWGWHPKTYVPIGEIVRIAQDESGTPFPCIVEKISANGINSEFVHLTIVTNSGEIWIFGIFDSDYIEYPRKLENAPILELPLQSIKSYSFSIFIRDAKNVSYLYDWCQSEGFSFFTNVFGKSHTFVQVPFNMIAYDSFLSIGINNGVLQALGRNNRKRAGLSEYYIIVSNWTNIEVEFIPNSYKVSHIYFSIESGCEVALFGYQNGSNTFDLLSCRPSKAIDIRTSLGGRFLFYTPVNEGRFLLRFNSTSSIQAKIAESLEVRDLENSLEIGEIYPADDEYSYYLDKSGKLRVISFEDLAEGLNGIETFEKYLPKSIFPITAISHQIQEIFGFQYHEFFVAINSGTKLALIRTTDLNCFFSSKCDIPDFLLNKNVTINYGPDAPLNDYFVNIVSSPGSLYALTAYGVVEYYTISDIDVQFVKRPFNYSHINGRIINLKSSYDGASPPINTHQRIIDTYYTIVTDTNKAYFWGSVKNFVDPDCQYTDTLCPNSVIDLRSVFNNPSEKINTPLPLLRQDISVSGVTLTELGAFIIENVTCGQYQRDHWQVCNGRGTCLFGQCVCYYGSGAAGLGNLCQFNYKCGNYFPDDRGVCNSFGTCEQDENGVGKCQCNFLFKGEFCNDIRPTFILLLLIPFSILFCIFCIASFGFCLTLITTLLIQRKRLQDQHIVQTLRRQLKAIDGLQDSLPPIVDLFMIDFSRISLQSCIAESSDAVIWKANLKDVGEVAIKFFSPDFGNTAREEDAYNEGKILCGFDHPNIVQFHGFTVRERTHIGIVMEFAVGGSLANHIRISSQPSQIEILNILVDICTGLAVLHSRGIIHRDIKPQNVLIQTKPQRKYKICDFGFAKKDNAISMNQTTSVIGTSFYIAPEVFLREGYTNSADVYSFGIMMWEILCWNLNPFGKYIKEQNFSALDITMQSANDPTFRPPTEKIIQSGNAWAAEIFQSCIDHDPTRRPTFLDLRTKFKQKLRELKLHSSEHMGYSFKSQAPSSELYFPLIDINIS